ncbi:MAG TPA: hypothetical protein VFS05_02140 [Gemmatimonadaceae bacterium]|nr:hypothetical protein [Gemmatimonadaceae bacterium]
MRTAQWIGGACVAALVMAAGCGRRGAPAGMSEQTFVTTMAALEAITRDSTRDSVAKAAARRKVLQERGLTPAELERAARSLARDPRRATELWSRIDSTTRALTTPRRPGSEADDER